MSSTSWKLLGRKHGGNMKNNRNVKSNQSYNNNGNWNTVYSDDDIKRLAYYNIDLPHVVGIGTQTPFSKLSFGDSSNSGYHPDSNGNIETTNGLTPGKLSSIALHEVTRNEENQPERRGQEFNGIGYVTKLMNVRNVDKNNTEANGVGIFSNKFAATEDTSQKTDKAIMYVTDSKHVQIGGVPTGYNLIDRNLQLLGNANRSFNSLTQETGPNIILDISGSMHVNGFINFLKYGNDSAGGPPAQLQDNPANQLTFNNSNGLERIEYAVDASKNSITNRAVPEGAIFVGWEKESGTATLIPKPRLYIMVNGVQKRIATEDDDGFYTNSSGGSVSGDLTWSGDDGEDGGQRFYIFRNNSDKPGTTMINTFSNADSNDFITTVGSNSLPAPAIFNPANGAQEAQALQVIGNLSVFDFHSGGTSGTKMNVVDFKNYKKVLASEIYQPNEALIDGQGNKTGKELGTIYTDRHIMIGGFKGNVTNNTVDMTFDSFGSAIDISGGTTGKPIMRAITGINKGSIKSSDPRDSIIIGNTPPGDFATKNTECILVGENARYENNENTLVMGNTNEVKNTKNSIVIGENCSVDGNTVQGGGSGLVVMGVDALANQVNDRIVLGTSSKNRALVIREDGTVNIEGDLNVEGDHVHLEVQNVVAEDKEIELNAKVSGTPATSKGAASGDDGGLCLFTTVNDENSKVKFTYDKTKDRWTTAKSTVTNGIGLAVGITKSQEQFVVKSNTDGNIGDLHMGTGTVDKFVVEASTGHVDMSGNLTMNGGNLTLNNGNLTMNGGSISGASIGGGGAGNAGDGTFLTITASGLATLNGGIVCDTDKFTVADTTGNVVTKGSFTVNGAGATTLGGTLGVTGITTLTGALNANGDVTIAADKNLTMSSGTGTFTTGTGDVTLNGNVTIATGQSFSSNNVDIDGGSIDGTTIGSSSASSGAFTTISASQQISANAGLTVAAGQSFSSNNVDIDGGSIDGTTIGSSSASSGAFTTITASTSIDVTGANGIILENDETITNSDNGTVLINGQVAAGTGSDDASGVFKSNGNYDVTLKTGNSTTGSIKIADGTNGNITVQPHGTGKTIIYEEFDDTTFATPRGAHFEKEANSNKVNLLISGDLTVKGDIDPKALILNNNTGGAGSNFSQYLATDLILYNDSGTLKLQYGTGGNNVTVEEVVTNATQQSTSNFLTTSSTIGWSQISAAVTNNHSVNTSNFLTTSSQIPYSSLTGTPTIPTNNLTLTNGAGYIKNESGAFSYSNLAGNPNFTAIQSGSFTLNLFPNGPLGANASVAYSSEIPTNNNELTNGAGFIKDESGAFNYDNLTNKPTIPTNNNQLTNGAGYITAASVTSSQWTTTSNAIYYGTGNSTGNNTAGNANVTRVGIHTNAPDYPLDVQKGLRYNNDPGWSSPYQNGNYNIFYRYDPAGNGLNFQGGSGSNAPSFTVAIRAKFGTIWADNQSLVSTSDRRIKENITEVPDNLALETLRKIECYYYEYKDKVQKGNQKTIGFIAQQVKEHLPMAVGTQKNTIPNEMRVLEATWDGLNMSCDLTDVSGVNYEFYVSNDPSGNDEVRKCVYGNKDNTFTFDKQYRNVFCYGKTVYDLNVLAKEKLFTLNFSATQEIDKIQREEKTKLAAAEERISALETENASLKAQLNSIEARLAALEA